MALRHRRERPGTLRKFCPDRGMSTLHDLALSPDDALLKPALQRRCGDSSGQIGATRVVGRVSRNGGLKSASIFHRGDAYPAQQGSSERRD